MKGRGKFAVVVVALVCLLWAGPALAAKAYRADTSVVPAVA
jgi:hypothetical protein